MTTVIGTRRTKLFLGAGVTDFTAEVSDVRIVSGEDKDGFPSFAQANAGGVRGYVLKLKVRQDTAAASLWYYLWAHAGEDLAYQFWPNGQNSVSPTTPTSTYPKFSGTAVIREPDGDLLGGEANRSATAAQAVEVEWQLTAKPTLEVA